ncbi:serine hydrolase [Clostridium sp. D2Q-11]|uniref:Serine hydrolase n=1 Tax=Anaeromonas frigoriresistens TaxID=2683708 RepID=A0A942Z5I0_9FIRM|nr:serine hydrolase [Anaeromonas frigoriresistens]MBS4537456.1 serine hydrolase [Anaeromonas frigoriresistens]
MFDIHKLIDEDKLKYSLYVEDLKDNKIIFDINTEESVSAASMIKIFIMAEAFNQVYQNKFMLEKNVTINGENIVGGSLIRNLSSYCFSIKDLIFLMMNLSDNTATNEIIDILGMENINDFIHKHGLKETVINRKMMDFEKKKQGFDNTTSVRDIAYILKKIYYKDLIDESYCDEMMHIMSKQVDNRMMSRNIDKSNSKIYHKTGDLPNLNHDAGVVSIDNREYLFCMLTWDGIDNIYGRKVIGNISEKVYKYFNETYGK